MTGAAVATALALAVLGIALAVPAPLAVHAVDFVVVVLIGIVIWTRPAA